MIIDLEQIRHDWNVAIIQSSVERDKALEMTQRLKALYNSRKAALEEIVGPLRDRIKAVEADARLDDIENFSRTVLAAVKDYDDRQAAAKAREATANLSQSTARLAAPFDQLVKPFAPPTQVEPVKPVPVSRDIVVTAVDLAVVPREYLIADEAAIKRALKLGQTIDGVEWEWKENAKWKA